MAPIDYSHAAELWQTPLSVRMSVRRLFGLHTIHGGWTLNLVCCVEWSLIANTEHNPNCEVNFAIAINLTYRSLHTER